MKRTRKDLLDILVIGFALFSMFFPPWAWAA